MGYIRLPEIQERLVAAARRAQKPVVVATQSWRCSPQPASPARELSDLSLIARQRADAAMLGKETVFSPRPIECIRLAREVLAYETQRLERLALRHPATPTFARLCRSPAGVLFHVAPLSLGLVHKQLPTFSVTGRTSGPPLDRQLWT